MTLDVKIEEVSIHSIIDKSDLSSDRKQILKKSKIILFPASFTSSHERGNFPSETPNLLRYIRVNYPKIDVEIFENPNEEKIQALHAADIILPPIYFAIQDHTIDLIIGILGAYLYDKFKGIPESDKNHVKSEIFIEDRNSGITKYVKYEGPVSGLNTIKNYPELEVIKRQ